LRYIQGLASVVGHADRAGPLRDYCTVPARPGERKSVEAVAAKTAPAHGCAAPLFTAFCRYGALLGREAAGEVRAMVLPAIEQHGPIEAWIIDDTAFQRHVDSGIMLHGSSLDDAWSGPMPDSVWHHCSNKRRTVFKVLKCGPRSVG
jgi:SRSO17 transposase